MNDSTEVKKKGFLKKLKDGDFGLAKTFWIYNILIGVVVQFMYAIIESIEPSTSMFLMMIAVSIIVVIYAIICLIGLWKAASKYTGPRVWPVLTKIWIVFAIIVNVAIFTNEVSGPTTTDSSDSINTTYLLEDY
jgi:hypothetical protein